MSGMTGLTKAIINENVEKQIKKAQSLLEKKSGVVFPESLILELMLGSVTDKTLLSSAKKHITESFK